MKLRNKKTGEVKKMWKDNICLSFGDCNKVYYSLAELNDDWEDYKPAEPLIKDAGARKVMRLWAKVNRIPTNATTIEYHYAESICGTESEFWDNNLHIMFYGKIAPDAIHGKIYTIDELCGVEEK